MNTAPKTEIIEAGDDISALVAFELPRLPAPGEIGKAINDACKIIYDKIDAEIAAHVPDVTTAKGRAAIKSLAYKISRVKTEIDERAAALVGDPKKIVDAVNAERREVKEELDRRRDKVRDPLTRWEFAEKQRVNMVEEARTLIKNVTALSAGSAMDEIVAAIRALGAMVIDPVIFLDEAEMVDDDRKTAIDTLQNAVKRIEREAAERAELEALRREKADREAAEAARIEQEKARAEREAAEQRAAEAEAARKAQEAKRIAALEAEATRKAEAEAARQIAEAEERARVAEQMAADAAKRAAEEERRRTEAAQRAAAEQAAKEKLEADRRAANKRHQSAVNEAAAKALRIAAPPLSEDDAMNIVAAISMGDIPSVSIRY